MLIVAPMGAGKTLSTLTVLSELVQSGQVRNALIIAPKRVAQSVWVQEASRHGIPLNIRYCEKAVDVKLHLYERLPRGTVPHWVCVCSITRIDEIPHGCWDCVIMDESTLFKNHASKRSKEVRRICNGVPWRIGLTGTPIHNGYEGLWHQCKIIDGGLALGKTLGEFRRRYCYAKYKVNAVVTVYDIAPERVSQLMLDCRNVIYVVRHSAKLPDLLYKDIEVELPATAMRNYREFEQTNVLTFEQEQGEAPYDTPKSLLAFCRTSLGIKLRQYASGTIYLDDVTTGRRPFVDVHREKVRALGELLEAHADFGGVLVAYQFQSELEVLTEHFPDARRIETEQDIKDWNAGKIKVAFVHPASVGHGLNLQYGGHVLVWYTLTYDGELYAQLNKRLHRSGQTEPVSIVHLIAKGTIDSRVLGVLRGKERTASAFVNGEL